MVFPTKTVSLTTPTVLQELTFLEADPVAAETLYQQWLNIQVKKQIGKFDPCSCVSYARWKSGINVGPIGIARNHPIDSEVPTVGGLVIINESKAGHLAVVTQVWGNTIVIDEYNYSPCAHTTREIQRDSSNIIGYYY